MKTGSKVVALAAGVALGWYADRFIKVVAPIGLDLLAARQEIDELAEGLRQSAEQIYLTVSEKTPTAYNHKLFTHIIGIERWGQRRLKVALGDPLLMDEYNSYRPPRDRNWEDLIQDFVKTRQETIAIANKLAQGDKAEQTIPHNTYGDLSVRAWLFYLRIHAAGELYRLKWQS